MTLASDAEMAQWYLRSRINGKGCTVDEAVDWMIDKYPSVDMAIIIQEGNKIKLKTPPEAK